MSDLEGFNRIAVTITKGTVDRWKTDLRIMTKVYRSVGPTPEDVPTFKEAMKLFRSFRENFDEWTYKVLLPKKGRGTQPYLEDEVRKKAWTALSTLSGLFPDQWNSVTDKHEPAPWLLLQNRETYIRRYQKAFTDAFKAIEEYIESKGQAGAGLERAEARSIHQVGPFNVVVLNPGRETMEEELDDFMRKLKEMGAKITHAGFAKAIEGLTVTVDFVREDLRAGHYNPSKDELVIFPLGFDRDTFFHEVGHRFWFRELPANARAHWNETLSTQTVEIQREDIEGFAAKYIEGQPSMLSRELVQLVNQKEDDPEIQAKYRTLADGSPGGWANTSREIEDYLVREFKGKRVYLEEISDYGNTSPVEAFAEVFMMWVAEGPGRVNPWTRQFFKEISRAGGAKIATKDPWKADDSV